MAAGNRSTTASPPGWSGCARPRRLRVDLEVPAKVAPGATFTTRVDDLHGYSQNDWGEPAYPEGTLSVTGPMEPSARLHVGESALAGGEPLPKTLTFTATGEAGETMGIDVVEGSSLIGRLPPGPPGHVHAHRQRPGRLGPHHAAGLSASPS